MLLPCKTTRLQVSSVIKVSRSMAVILGLLKLVVEVDEVWLDKMAQWNYRTLVFVLKPSGWMKAGSNWIYTGGFQVFFWVCGWL